jgi:hypothetical protein
MATMLFAEYNFNSLSNPIASRGKLGTIHNLMLNIDVFSLLLISIIIVFLLKY